MRRPRDSGRPSRRRRLLLIVAASVRHPLPGLLPWPRRPPRLPPTGQAPVIPDLAPGCPAPCCSVSRRGFLAARASAGGVPSRGRALGFRRVRPASPMQPVPHSGGLEGPGPVECWGEGPGAPACRKVQALDWARQPGLTSGAPVPHPARSACPHPVTSLGGRTAWQVGRRRQCSDPQDPPWASPTPGPGFGGRPGNPPMASPRADTREAKSLTIWLTPLVETNGGIRIRGPWVQSGARPSGSAS